MNYISATATLSECGKHRYTLERLWDADADPMCVIGLNPSTADATQDDPTIRRCVGFAQREGCGGLIMVNLFTIRETDSSTLKSRSFGELCDAQAAYELILSACRKSAVTVAAWGTQGVLYDRGERVKAMLQAAGLTTFCLGVNRNGTPKHPLYERADAPLLLFTPELPATRRADPCR